MKESENKKRVAVWFGKSSILKRGDGCDEERGEVGNVSEVQTVDRVDEEDRDSSL